MIRISLWGSGTGSNAEKILQYFENHKLITVSLIVSDREDARILTLPQKFSCVYPDLDSVYLSKELRKRPELIIELLENYKIAYIILAGYLKLINKELLEKYANKILNIHPSLLPKFGGKGMFGMRVHEAVIQAGEKESGLTIHLVNEHYDEGQVLFQHKIAVDTASPQELQKKILALEHLYYPQIIESYILNEEKYRYNESSQD